jgi:predicted GNAT family acetyltransferase
VAARLKTRPLGSADRPAALARLAAAPRQNLLLLDLVARLGAPPSPGEMPAQVLGAWRGRELMATAALRPSLLLDSEMELEALEALLPYLCSLETGLVKSAEAIVTPLWERLRARGRSARVDRIETAYALERDAALPVAACVGARVRRARARDLEDLVMAARASLREEDRPDPFEGDPVGFRRWVGGRLHRARVVEVEGRVVFVAYADVRRPEGWLIQGVYTWPRMRRRGYAAAGTSALVEEAFRSGTDHVQLTVVDGNLPAIRLYQGLGFKPFARLRTVLFR